MEPERDIERALLLTESMYVALPRDHPLADAPTVNLADLADEPWLCGSGPSTCAEIVHLACQTAGFEPKVSFESDDYSVQQGFVAGGLGVTLLPDLALATLRSDVVVRPDRARDPEASRVGIDPGGGLPLARRRGDGRDPEGGGRAHRGRGRQRGLPGAGPEAT